MANLESIMRLLPAAAMDRLVAAFDATRVAHRDSVTSPVDFVGPFLETLGTRHGGGARVDVGYTGEAIGGKRSRRYQLCVFSDDVALDNGVRAHLNDAIWGNLATLPPTLSSQTILAASGVRVWRADGAGYEYCFFLYSTISPT